MSKPGIGYSRVAAAIVAACGGAVLLLLPLLGIANFFTPVTSLGLLIIAALIFGLFVARAPDVRAAWRRSCVINGLLSGGAAVGFRLQDEPWSGGPGHMQDIDRAIGPLDRFLWGLAARGGIVVLVLAALLFALSYWLLGPPRRKA